MKSLYVFRLCYIYWYCRLVNCDTWSASFMLRATLLSGFLFFFFTQSINNSYMLLPRYKCIPIIAFIIFSPLSWSGSVHYWDFTMKSSWALYLPVTPGGPGGPGNPGGPGKPSLPGGPGIGNPGEPFSPFSPLWPGTPGDPTMSGTGRPLSKVKYRWKKLQVKRITRSTH